MRKLLFLFSMLIVHQLSAQFTVSGKITDKITKEPIIGAYVIDIDDPSNGGVSDLDGNYKLTLPAGEHRLLFKFTGMENDTVLVKIDDNPNLVINVEMGAKTLNTIDVVVGKFDKKVEELTFSMEVLKPDLIENKNTRSIESILDQTPGLNIMDGEPQIRGGSGFTFGVGSKVSVLVDDMPMLSGDAGRPEWSFIPVENIEQIEITKGASSVLSGSSALSGSIHIRTAYPKAKPLTKINVYSGFYSEPQGDSTNWWGEEYPFIHGMNFLHSRIIKKYTDLVIGGNINWDHGYIGGPIKGEEVFDTLSEEFTNKQMQHKKARLNFNLRRRSKKFEGLQYGINGNFMVHKTNLVLAWLDDSSGIYRAYPGAALLQDQVIFNVDPYVEFYSKIGVKHSLKTRMMYSSNEMTGNQSNLAKVYYADYQFKKEFTFLQDKSFDFIGGVSSQFNDSDAELYTGEFGDGSNNLFNLSGYAEIQKDFFKVLNFSIGGRAEYYKLNDTITQWKPIFRTGANLKLGQATFLRASYGQGYRFPTITERYIRTAVGSFGVFDNPDILPEESWNAEVGVNQGYKIGKNYMGQIDVAAFLQHYENTIEYLFGFWDPNPNPFAGEPLAGFKFLNTGKSQITGFDITLNGKAKIGKNFELTHAIGYNYINPVTLEPDLVFATDYNFGTPQDFSFRSTSVDTTTNTLKYRFKHTFKADVEMKYKGFAIGYTIKYFSRMENLDKAIEEFENITLNTGGTLQAVLYQDFFAENNNGNIIMDLRMSYGFGKKYKHKFSVVSKNLTNNLYSLRPLKIEAMRSTVLQYTFSF
ncbi:MAG: TonB-dependent receptor [Crocinitomicaceae bacterium]